MNWELIKIAFYGNEVALNHKIAGVPLSFFISCGSVLFSASTAIEDDTKVKILLHPIGLRNFLQSKKSIQEEPILSKLLSDLLNKSVDPNKSSKDFEKWYFKLER